MKFQIETGNENNMLRKKATPISLKELKSYTKVAESMVKYIKDPEKGGVGLAAPQIGISKRLIVVSLMHDYEDENFRTIAMINPEIIEHTEEVCTDSEGCLSVPGEFGDVTRWTGVKVEFLNLSGIKQSLKLTDLAARIVQHEIDHLDGILFTDKVEENTLKKA